ncbi:MAG: AlpA family phage regulatory protein [Acidobacteria bacterium]|nr:AlpA family phage regulatory protein [Acidobacteriota bacterium]
MKRNAIYKKMRAGEFPEPYRVGRTAVRWSEREIEAWVAALPGPTDRRDPVVRRLGVPPPRPVRFESALAGLPEGSSAENRRYSGDVSGFKGTAGKGEWRALQDSNLRPPGS